MPQSGLNFAGYSQVGSAGGTGSPFAPPPPTPSSPSSQQQQQQQQQNHHHQLQQMAQVQRFGPTAAVPHHMHQQHMQQHTEQNQISKPPIRLVAVDEGAIHKQAQDFLMAMTVIQASAHSLPFHRTLLLPRPRACDASLVLRLSLSPFANNWWGNCENFGLGLEEVGKSRQQAENHLR